MSTVAEIEAAIEQLPPEEYRALREWMAKREETTPGRLWSPEELGAAAEQMVSEDDPEKANEMWKQIKDGFYGRAGA